VQKYLSEKKLILLLDLDNTILHAANISFTEEEYQILRNKYGKEIAKLKIAYQSFLVKFRPCLKEFFERIKNFDIFVYTYGTLDYAKAIINYLNTELDVKSLNMDKLVARENNNFESKNIKKIFPSTESMVVILDDRTDVWSNRDNLINVSPYFFFTDEKIYKTDGKKHIDEDLDCVLYSVSNLMNFIYAVFYRYYEKNREIIDNQNQYNDKSNMLDDNYRNFNSEINRTILCVKTILFSIFKSILSKKNFCLSGIYPLEQDIFETKHNYFIELLGGSLYENYTEDVDIILVRKIVGKYIFETNIIFSRIFYIKFIVYYKSF